MSSIMLHCVILAFLCIMLLCTDNITIRSPFVFFLYRWSYLCTVNLVLFNSYFFYIVELSGGYGFSQYFTVYGVVL